MASTDKVSEQRQRAVEPTDVADLLAGGAWEIENLAAELRDNEHHPAVHYSLYPRLRAAVTLHLRARAAIASALANIPEVAGWEHEQNEWEKILACGEFASLARRLDVAIPHLRESVIPAIVGALDCEQRAQLGEKYKAGLSA